MPAIDYPRHYLSEIWGDIPEAEAREMADSMATSDEAIVVHMLDGHILDGYNRNKEAIRAGRTPEYVQYTGNDPAGFVIRQNALRRHLNASQRAAAITAAVNWRSSALGEESADEEKPTRMRLAESIDVSRSTMAQAQRGVEHGLGPMILDGSMSAKTADLIVKHDLSDQVVSGEVSIDQARDLVADREAERAADRRANREMAEPDDIPDREDARNLDTPPEPVYPDTSPEAEAPVAGEPLPADESAERIEQLEADREMLLLEAENDRTRIDELTTVNELLRAASTGLDEDIEALFRSKDAEISALKSELNILQGRFNEERETSERLRRQLDREKERNGRARNGIQANAR